MHIFPQALNHLWNLKVLVAQLCSTLCDLLDRSPTVPLSTKFSRKRILEWDFLLQRIFVTHALQADSLLSEPSGKPLNHLSITYNIECSVKAIQRVTSMKQFQVLALGNLWILKKYFWSEDGWICRCGSCRWGRLTILMLCCLSQFNDIISSIYQH